MLGRIVEVQDMHIGHHPVQIAPVVIGTIRNAGQVRTNLPNRLVLVLQPALEGPLPALRHLSQTDGPKSLVIPVMKGYGATCRILLVGIAPILFRINPDGIFTLAMMDLHPVRRNGNPCRPFRYHLLGTDLPKRFLLHALLGMMGRGQQTLEIDGRWVHATGLSKRFTAIAVWTFGNIRTDVVRPAKDVSMMIDCRGPGMFGNFLANASGVIMSSVIGNVPCWCCKVTICGIPEPAKRGQHVRSKTKNGKMGMFRKRINRKSPKTPVMTRFAPNFCHTACRMSNLFYAGSFFVLPAIGIIHFKT